MTSRFRALAVSSLLTVLSGAAGADAQVYPGTTWPQRTPAEAGLDVVKLDQLASLVLGSGMIVRDGYQVYTWGDCTQPYDWASASKALTSTWLMMADDEGLCSVNSAAGTYLSGGSLKDSSMTFHQLANMMSGYSRQELPGQSWAYNDRAFNVYGYVLSYHVFGLHPQGVFDTRMGFLQPQDPYSINGEFQYGRVKAMSIRDFARIGLFWLKRGEWDGVQRLPSAYFDTYVTNQVPAALPSTAADGAESWNLGTHGGSDDIPRYMQGHYGMDFYVNTNGLWAGLPSDIYQANGHDGREICTVIPGLNMVAVGAGGYWGDPSTQAIALLYQAQFTTGVEGRSWGAIKAGYRE